MIVNVLIPFALDTPYSYKTKLELEIGNLVLVHFINKYVVGLVIEINVETNITRLKEINKKLSLPPIKKELIDFIKWVAEYNIIPLGIVLKMVIEPANYLKDETKKKYKLNFVYEKSMKITKKQQLLIDYLSNKKETTEKEILEHLKIGKEVIRNLIKNNVIKEFEEIITENENFIQKIKNFNLNILSNEQNEIFEKIYNNKNYNVFVLEGTTGSGKTEIYFHLIAKILDETDKQILLLLPEIALTSQLIKRFEKQFNFKPSVWHSEIGKSVKNEIFKGIINKKVRILIGTRSSLFLPFKDLGLIIVDEEHDSSYKQIDNGCYNGRDSAIVRAKLNNIPIILGSATPSLETLINIDRGKYQKIFLQNRFGKAVLPNVEIIDLKKEKLKRDTFLSKKLVNALNENLITKKQSMIFLNRRGYAPIVLCGDCGDKIQCLNCFCNLNYHKSKNKLFCHYCGYSVEKPTFCQKCGSKNLIEFGPGVEKIEKEINEIFPNARTIIMTSDTINTSKKLEDAITKILNNEIDIIIGTQLIAKGHHFPNLTIVGVVDSDASLFGGDIRTSERTYQLLTQVSGRAGREEIKGNIYLQTYNPDNLILNTIKDGNKELLIKFEKENRKIGNFPPFWKMATISISSIDEILAYKTSKHIVTKFPIDERIEILGPAPAPIFKIAKMYRYNIIVKTNKNISLQKLLKNVVFSEKYNGNIRIKINVDS